MPRLTRRLIDQTPTPAVGETVLWDDQLPGFGIRIPLTGRKVFFVRYRTARQRRRFRLGLYGVLTPEQARQLAQEVLLRVSMGDDPAQDRRTQRTAPTVAEAVTRYLIEHAEVHYRPESLRKARQLMQQHLVPTLGQVPIAQLTTEDLRTLHRQLRGVPIAANRLLAYVSKLCALAEDWRMRPRHSNPTVGIRRYKETKRQRYLSGEELQRLGSALAAVEALQVERKEVIACVRLLLLTGARLGEICRLKWEYLDDRGIAWLPQSKTGPKPLYFPQPALEVLETLPRSSVWVLPGINPAKPMSQPQRPWYRLCARAGVSNVRLHDLRHTFASLGVQSGLSLPIIGALLGHQRPGTTHRYAHLADDPLRQAATRISGLIATALQPPAC